MQKLIILLFSIVTLVTGCKEKSDEKHMHHEHDAEASDAVEVSENQILYNEVMKIHDEVMPEMETIYKKRKELNDRIKTDISEAEKQRLTALVNKLDSADKAMMDWMHDFKPVPDSEGEEKAREYLENELEKIKQVKETMQSAIKEADAQ